MNQSLTIKSGQCHVHRYMRPLIVNGEIDPTVVITHRMPLADAPKGYQIVMKKEDNCEKVVLLTLPRTRRATAGCTFHRDP
jgi:threonine dehydrogenase-like Zn-dependent dehydrogenase